MKIVLAPDSFKGTLSSMEIIDHLEEAARDCFTSVEVVKVPIADGGEGTVDALVLATDGQYRYVEVMGPLSEQKVRAKYGIINGKTAVIEMAEASGLPLVPQGQKNPLLTTTYGTGQIIKKALDEGIRDFVIGIGGSATNDGGIGACQALGVKFLDNNGQEVGFGGQELSRIQNIIIDGMDHRVKESSFTVICDVNNPLTGPKGATAIYGPQKGVTNKNFQILESGMVNYQNLIKKVTGLDMATIPGSGAAGGLGAAFVTFFDATLKPGIDAVLDYVDFDNLIKDADLVVTGEGRIDGQSVYGKVPVGVAQRCKPLNIPVVAIVGGMGDDAQRVYDHGIDSIMTTVNSPMPIQEALSRADELMKDAAIRLFRLIKIGVDL
ncbi:MAG: glycerate kinase [Clostridiales bacterium]|nr:glycerate kinase [Clostridiales bacterium]